MGHLLRATQVAPDIGHQISWVNSPATPHGIGLYVLVQQLVGVQLRTVRRKEKYLQVLLLPLEPPRRLLGLMRRVLVHDQDYLPADLSPEALQKPNEHPPIEPLLEHHEIQTPPVSDR